MSQPPYRLGRSGIFSVICHYGKSVRLKDREAGGLLRRSVADSSLYSEGIKEETGSRVPCRNASLDGTISQNVAREIIPGVTWKIPKTWLGGGAPRLRVGNSLGRLGYYPLSLVTHGHDDHKFPLLLPGKTQEGN